MNMWIVTETNPKKKKVYKIININNVIDLRA